MSRLQDQVAIITGGSRGIGRAVARAFAHEGARVAIAAVSDRNELETARKEIADLGSDVVAMLADVLVKHAGASRATVSLRWTVGGVAVG